MNEWHTCWLHYLLPQAAWHIDLSVFKNTHTGIYSQFGTLYIYWGCDSRGSSILETGQLLFCPFSIVFISTCLYLSETRLRQTVHQLGKGHVDWGLRSIVMNTKQTGCRASWLERSSPIGQTHQAMSESRPLCTHALTVQLIKKSFSSEDPQPQEEINSRTSEILILIIMITMRMIFITLTIIIR